MPHAEFKIPTPDGAARAFAFTPEGQGPWPAVVFFMDAIAIRPTLFEMCQRLADHGYYVLLPDMFWRIGPYEPVDAKALFASEEGRKAMFARIAAATDHEKAGRDIAACVTWLETQPDVTAGPIGVTGYCMGGGWALRAAAAFADRVAACGVFHAGRLATDAPDSPHRLAPQIRARVYVGGADNDASFAPAEAERLTAALDAAGVANTMEIYPGALHGYTMADTPVFNAAAAERHWRALTELLHGALKA